MRFVRPGGPAEGPVAPVSPLESASASGAVARHEPRRLGGGDGYLVDSNGNEVPSYSLSWRLLGVFVDTNNCDGDGDRRRLGGDGDGSCRKVLWAAYHDPEYEGNSIAEYSFYQRESGTWDSQTCKAQSDGQWWAGGGGTRCRRLDCHERGTELELVGVFKETDGLYDFTEQLFKHQGYCLWDEDKRYGDGESHHSGDDEDGEETSDYQFMQNLQENWVYGCTELEDAADDDGNSLYYDTKPLPGGDMTYGVYTDASCTVESSITWSDVLSKMADNDSQDDDDDGLPSMDSIARWNQLLGDYKICQPCRTYNRVVTSDGSSSDSDQSEDEEAYGDDYDGEDGEGGKERYGFNCYDDAGYQNCNQCYKFQTQTNMERASTSDLELATAQGTILGVTIGDVTYGKGYYSASAPLAVRTVEWTLAIVVAAAAMVFFGLYLYGRRLRRARRVGDDDDGLEENLRGGGGGKRSRSRSRRRRRGRDGGAGWRVCVATAARQIRADTRALAGLPGADPASEAARSPTGKKKYTYKDCKKKYLVAQLENRDARLAEQEEQMRDLREKVSYYKYLLNKAACAAGVPAADDEEQQGADASELAGEDKERPGTPSTAGTDVEQQGLDLGGDVPQDKPRYIPPPSVETDVEQQQGSDPGAEAPQDKTPSEASTGAAVTVPLRERVKYYKERYGTPSSAKTDAEQQESGPGGETPQTKERSGTPPSAGTDLEQQGSDLGGEYEALTDAIVASGVPVVTHAGQRPQGSGPSGEMKYSTLPKRQPNSRELNDQIAVAEQMQQMAEGALERIKAREAQQRKQDDDDDDDDDVKLT